jgi:hypothetical protein
MTVTADARDVVSISSSPESRTTRRLYPGILAAATVAGCGAVVAGVDLEAAPQAAVKPAMAATQRRRTA